MEPKIIDDELTDARVQRQDGHVHNRPDLAAYTFAAQFGDPNHQSSVTIVVLVPEQSGEAATRTQAIAKAKNVAQLFYEIEPAFFRST